MRCELEIDNENFIIFNDPTHNVTYIIRNKSLPPFTFFEIESNILDAMTRAFPDLKSEICSEVQIYREIYKLAIQKYKKLSAFA